MAPRDPSYKKACPHCNKVVTNLKRHVATHHDPSLFLRCPYCPCTFLVRWAYDRHMYNAHGVPVPDPAQSAPPAAAANNQDTAAPAAPDDDQTTVDDGTTYGGLYSCVVRGCFFSCATFDELDAHIFGEHTGEELADAC